MNKPDLPPITCAKWRADIGQAAQRALFDKGDAGPLWRKMPANPCTPARPGTGPEGKKCKDCAHYSGYRSGAGRIYRKCALMRHAWTRGPGSDIKANWPACAKYAEPGPDDDREPEPI
jgi:hypothetical protein